MKNELNQIEDMICILNDQEPKPRVSKPSREERPLESNKPYEK